MIRCYADNVVIALEPQETETASGLALVRTSGPGAKEHRTARVVASGPGFHTRLGALVPNSVKPGDRVIVSALAGDRVKWDWNLSAPRQNSIPEFDGLPGVEGKELRIVREQEILAVLGDEAQAAE